MDNGDVGLRNRGDGGTIGVYRLFGDTPPTPIGTGTSKGLGGGAAGSQILGPKN